MRKVYPVLFRENKESKVPFYVKVPDLDAVTQGMNMVDAIEMARDIICIKLEYMESKGVVPPEPGSVQFDREDGDIVSYVDFDYDEEPFERVTSLSAEDAIKEYQEYLCDIAADEK